MIHVFLVININIYWALYVVLYNDTICVQRCTDDELRARIINLIAARGCGAVKGDSGCDSISYLHLPRGRG